MADQLRELLGSRDLFMLLLGRELKVRYKQTALGIVWVVLQPLVPAVIFAVVFGTFARLPSADTPYLLFALTGLVLYGLFAGIVSRSGASLVRDSQLITKVYFPRSLLPLASGSAAVVDFLVGVVVIGVAVIAFGWALTPLVLLAPLVVALTMAFSYGIGLAIAALTAHFRDFGYAVPFMLQVLLYGSPVVYSMELIPEGVRPILAINPLVLLIEAFRTAVLGTPPPDAAQVLIGTIAGVVSVFAGVTTFVRMSRGLTDVV